MKRKGRGRARPGRTGQDRLNTLFIALIMLGAVILGLLLPSVTAYIQGLSTEKTEQQVELGAGELSLTSDDAKLERLRLIELCIAMEEEGRPVETVGLSDGRFMDAGDAIDKLSAVMALTEGSGLPMADFTTADLQFADALLLVTDAGNMATTVLWQVNFSKPTGEQLSYVLDDSTGTIIGVGYYCGALDTALYDQGQNMSTAGLAANMPEPARAMEALAENLAACWNFSETQVRAPELSGAMEINPYENVYYLSLGRDGELLLEVPVRISFDSWSINAN